MRIHNETQIQPLPAALPKEQLLKSLRPGQILQGTALSENLNGTIKLQIGVARFIAQTQLSVKPGQSLNLQVEKAGDFPQLNLLIQPNRRQQQATALKNLLPRQQPMPQLLEKLLQHSSTSRGTSALPSEIKQAIQTLLERLPSADSPEFKKQLLQALQNSGLFTEAGLLSQTSGASDLKLNLLRLFRLLQNGQSQQIASAQAGTELNDTPAPELQLLRGLLKQLDAALARIQTNQLASLPQDESPRQSWQLELPVLHGGSADAWQIRISRDSASPTKPEESIWRLTLHMNLQPLGPMRFHLTLQGDAVSTVICSEREATKDLVKSRLSRLKNALESAGLEVKKLETHQSRIEEPTLIPADLSLLSEKA